MLWHTLEVHPGSALTLQGALAAWYRSPRSANLQPEAFSSLHGLSGLDWAGLVRRAGFPLVAIRDVALTFLRWARKNGHLTNLESGLHLAWPACVLVGKRSVSFWLGPAVFWLENVASLFGLVRPCFGWKTWRLFFCFGQEDGSDADNLRLNLSAILRFFLTNDVGWGGRRRGGMD